MVNVSEMKVVPEVGGSGAAVKIDSPRLAESNPRSSSGDRR
jgi:hypothetical protein